MLKLQSAPRPSGRAILRIPIQDIRLNPRQPRRQFQPESIAALAESIRRYGLLSPLLVRSLPDGGYELIAGERRLRALRRLERTHAEAIVTEADDCGSALMALVENLQREDLHYLDAAAACKRILESQPITQERLAASLCCSPSALANRLRLLKLSPEVQTAIRLHGLSERHARALLKLDAGVDQLSLVRETSAQHLSVKQLEVRVEQRLRGPSAKRRQASPLVRDNRLVINAVLDTVRELSRIGVPVRSRVEEREDHVEVIVSIPTVK